MTGVTDFLSGSDILIRGQFSAFNIGASNYILYTRRYMEMIILFLHSLISFEADQFH